MFDAPTNGPIFFAWQSIWSTMTILIVVTTCLFTKCGMRVCLIEFCALLANVLAYMGEIAGGNLFYWHYYAILDALSIIELIVLLCGAPWDGIFGSIQHLWSAAADVHQPVLARVQNFKNMAGKTK
jgi:hypothetical protein